ncbi:hypothetical protein HN51_028162, partial [Arachis hypogaea]
IWTISILNTLCCLMTFPKEHSIFRLHILFCRITSLRKRLALMKNFLGHKVSLERASQ